MILLNRCFSLRCADHSCCSARYFTNYWKTVGIRRQTTRQICALGQTETSSVSEGILQCQPWFVCSYCDCDHAFCHADYVRSASTVAQHVQAAIDAAAIREEGTAVLPRLYSGKTIWRCRPRRFQRQGLRCWLSYCVVTCPELGLGCCINR
jgi:hypothetical protein